MEEIIDEIKHQRDLVNIHKDVIAHLNETIALYGALCPPFIKIEKKNHLAEVKDVIRKTIKYLNEHLKFKDISFLVFSDYIKLNAYTSINEDAISTLEIEQIYQAFNGIINALRANDANDNVGLQSQFHDTVSEIEFIYKNYGITQPEALLYYDDLTMPIGAVPGLIKTLQKLVELSPSICRLSVNVNGTTQSGTGFRIAEKTLLTNWHVLHRLTDGVRATGVMAEFGYEDDGRGGFLNTTSIPCEVNSIVANQQNDWSIITATKSLDSAWPIINLYDSARPVDGSFAYIIQHPRGERKRVGFIRNQITGVTDTVVHYLTDTQAGSSGSPVLNPDGKLIAVHHAGGRPQKMIDKPPIKKNEGILISKILEDFKQQNVQI